jgi:hypothetical protein
MEPQKYDGKSDVRDYLLQFDIIAGVNGWDTKLRGQRLAGSLTEGAREVLGALGARRASRYKYLVPALLKKYSPEGQEAKYIVQLMNRKCSKKESVSEYERELRKLARLAYPDSPVDERVLVGLFARGLSNREMRRQVQVSRCRDLDEALVIALTCEAVDEASENDRPHKPKPNSSPTARVGSKGKGRRRRGPNRQRSDSSPEEEGVAAPVAHKSLTWLRLLKL